MTYEHDGRAQRRAAPDAAARGGWLALVARSLRAPVDPVHDEAARPVRARPPHSTTTKGDER